MILLVIAAAELSPGEARDLLVSAAAVLTALAIVGRLVVMPLVKFGRRLERVMESVESQLYPNAGSTLRDAVTSIQHELGIEVHMPHHDPNHVNKEKP